MKGLDRYIKANVSKALNDVDFHDLMDMVEDGMSHSEIARELGVSDTVVQWLTKEIEKDV